MQKISLILALGSSVITPLIAAPGDTAGASLPNVVFIFADDLGVGDVAYYHEYFINQGMVSQNHFNYEGTTPETVIATPNMDRICEQGMIFTDAQLPAALCAPNRFCVLTGNTTIRSREFGTWGNNESSGLNFANSKNGQTAKLMTYDNGVVVVDGSGNPATGAINGFGDRRNNPHDTLGNILQAAGYHTGYFGKMHIGGDFYDWDGDLLRYNFFPSNPNGYDAYDYSRQFGQGMLEHGFDYTFVSPDGIQGRLYMYFENDTYKPIDTFDQDVENWWPGSMNSAPLGTNSTLRYFDPTRFTGKNLAGPFAGTYAANTVYGDKGKLVTTSGNSDMVNTHGEIYARGFGDSRFDTSEHGPILAYHAVKFIEEHVAANANQPFMLFYAAPAIHVPLTPSAHALGSTGLGKRSDFVVDLDQQVGKILDALDSLNIADNTLVILSSDNGGTVTNIAQQETSNRQHPSGPWRGAKSSIYEGGHRVPFAFKWGDNTNLKSVIEPGTICDHHISIIDVAASLMDLTGQSTASDQHQDSISLLPFLMSETPSSEDAIRTHHFYTINKSTAYNKSVRMDDTEGKWLYLRPYTHSGTSTLQELELYDLATDPGQQTNLATGYTDVADVPAGNAYKAKLIALEDWFQNHNSTFDARTEEALNYDPKGAEVTHQIVTTGSIVSVNFTNSSGGGAISIFGVDSEGTVSSNWENLSTSTNDLADETGIATTVDITIPGTPSPTWFGADYSGTPIHVGNLSNGSSSITFSDLNATFPNGYKAIAYLGGYTGNTDASISDGTTTYYYQTLNPTQVISSATITRTTDTSNNSSSPTAQYALFGSETILSSDNLTLTLSKLSGGGAALCGVQIFDVNVSEESIIQYSKTPLIVPTKQPKITIDPVNLSVEYSNLELSHPYTILTTTDLTRPWTPMPTAIELFSGSSVSEQITENESTQFYRLSYPAKTTKHTLPLGP
ncbi:MAG: arylsulfatase A-like enzyme [Lentimonas sp.]|jgi:arylsulfatase A-like enzyme